MFMKQIKLMAILNITPDSFSDGGLYQDQATVAKQLEYLLDNNADIIDIGAISTKPQSLQPSIEEEIKRFKEVLPVIIPILKNSSVEISIDSYNYDTLKYLAEYLPINWVNDQKGFIDKRLIDFAKETKAKLVIMHHLNIPADPSKYLPHEVNVVEEVKNWLIKRAEYLISSGIDANQIVLDPGIGFGKTANQSWQLIKQAKSFTKLDFPIMYGHSRKSFLNLITNKEFIQRDLETAIISSYLADAGVDYLRIHNVEATTQALKIREFLGEING